MKILSLKSDGKLLTPPDLTTKPSSTTMSNASNSLSFKSLPWETGYVYEPV